MSAWCHKAGGSTAKLILTMLNCVLDTMTSDWGKMWMALHGCTIIYYYCVLYYIPIIRIFVDKHVFPIRYAVSE